MVYQSFVLARCSDWQAGFQSEGMWSGWITGVLDVISIWQSDEDKDQYKQAHSAADAAR